MIINLSNMHSGFSDRIRPITFGIMLSGLLNEKNKNFEIFENKTKECPFLFTNLCKIKKFKVKRLKTIKDRKTTFMMTPFNSEINQENLKTHMPIKRGNFKNLLNIWKNSYKFIYPSAKISKKIKKLNLPKNYIGIHIRATDKVMSVYSRLFEIPSKSSITKLQLKLFLKNLPKIISKNSKYKNIYLACDDKKIKEISKKILINNNFNVYEHKSKYNLKRMRQTSGKDFVTDLFCLSNSKIIISSTGGGVPSTARLLSTKKIKMINYLDQKNIFYILKILNYVFFNIRKKIF